MGSVAFIETGVDVKRSRVVNICFLVAALWVVALLSHQQTYVAGTKLPPVSQEAWEQCWRLGTEGNRALREQRLEEAERFYNEALTYAEWHSIRNNRGWIRAVKGDYKTALEDANLAIEAASEPEDLKHYYHTKATALEGLGRRAEALEAVEESLRQDPDFAESLDLRRSLQHRP